MSEGQNPTPGRSHPNQRFGRLVSHARWSLWWEEAWPRLWLPLAIVLAFFTLSWLGLWLDASPLWRTIGLGLFAAALLLSLWPLARLRLPSRTRALDRLDRETGLTTGPARVLDDTLALGSADPGTRALWALHRKRAEDAIGRMRVGLPQPEHAQARPLCPARGRRPRPGDERLRGRTRNRLAPRCGLRLAPCRRRHPRPSASTAGSTRRSIPARRRS